MIERFFIALLFFVVHSAAQAAIPLAIIIDDLGNDANAGQRIVDLPAKITLAILPHRPVGPKLAKLAHASGKEVMLHMPMQDIRESALGLGGLTLSLDKTEFKSRLRYAIDSLPHVRGINNHKGSLLTQENQQMAWVMKVLKRRQLYFVDSRTSKRTVAAEMAQRNAVPHIARQVFLDNEVSDAAITQRFAQLLKRAQREGYGVAIGHPYAATIRVLKRELAQLEQRGFKVVPVSELLGEGVLAQR